MTQINIIKLFMTDLSIDFASRSKFKIISYLILLSCVWLSFGTSGRSEEVIFNVMVPQRSALFRNGIKPWIEEMERSSEGQLKFRIPPASMAPPQRQLDLVHRGVADFAFAPNAYFEPAVRLPNVAGIPFAAVSAEAASVALWRTYESYFSNAEEYKQVKVLGLFTLGDAVIQSRRPITNLEALHGLKIRTAPGIQAEIAEALGAVAVPAAGIKQFELVNGGIVDANLGSIESANLMKTGNLLKYFVQFEGGINRTSVVIFMNEETFDSLPDKARAAIDATSYENISRALGRQQDNANRMSAKKMTETGVEIRAASSGLTESIRPLLGFVRENWLRSAAEIGVDGQAALDFYLQTVMEVETELQSASAAAQAAQ